MSTVEEAVTPTAEGTQQFGYCSPVAAFRNQLKPLPNQPVVQAHGKNLQIVQGYPEAVISAAGTSNGRSYPNVLQYLCRDPQGGFSLQPFAQGQYRCNGAAVIAQNSMGAPGSVNCFWIDETGAMRQAWMDGQSSWSGRYNPTDPSSVPNKYNPKTWNTKLGNLHVAYTPATPGGGGRNPVVYAAQGGDALVTVKWDSPSGTWATTVYDGLGGGLSYNDLVLVPTSEQGFDLIANVTKSSDLGFWTGTFSNAGSLSRNSSAFPGNPAGNGNGALRQVIAGGNSATNTACAFYTDDSGTLLMWPTSSGASRPSPVPVADTSTWVGAGQLSGTGTRTSLYFSAVDDIDFVKSDLPPDGDLSITSSLWFIPQLLWALDGQLPFFAPPSQVVASVNAVLSVVAPVAHPAELAALFVVNSAGHLYLFRPDDTGYQAAHTVNQAAYGTQEWAGGPILLANKQPFSVDVKSYS
ncbi:MAG: hypothetical protein WC558_10580 [Patulibacter sp.]